MRYSFSRIFIGATLVVGFTLSTVAGAVTLNKILDANVATVGDGRGTDVEKPRKVAQPVEDATGETLTVDTVTRATNFVPIFPQFKGSISADPTAFD
ncbi:hypothetical protein [Lysinibacter sp. HNR]|uniref:hypothetical protein n=1 Tax=Lysinibacter sp. HNR TaxID=3031408 RepID=UPI002434CE2B|nr:hypothetical protein [Lysinibacter sp. HNR]WGD37151.1 hypothetical protein FrondiHNR_12060 [Lysinibacter sp. HNR]